MGPDAMGEILISGLLGFVWGWTRGSKDSTVVANRARRDAVELLTTMSVIATDKPIWTRTLNGSYRVRFTQDRLDAAATALPHMSISCMPREDAMGDEVVVDLYPEGREEK